MIQLRKIISFDFHLIPKNYPLALMQSVIKQWSIMNSGKSRGEQNRHTPPPPPPKKKKQKKKKKNDWLLGPEMCWNMNEMLCTKI